MLETLDQVAWETLFHQDHPVLPATNVPTVLRALADRGPNHVLSFDPHPVGAYGRPTVQKVPRSVATEFADLMRVSPVTPRMVPFVVELAGSALDPMTRRVCVRWLQSFFRYCTTGQITATFDLDHTEKDAAWVESVGFPAPLLRGAAPDSMGEGLPLVLDLAREKLGEHGGVWELRRLFDALWRREIWRAIASGLEVVLGALDAGDEVLSGEVIALTSWLPQRRDVIAPRLEAVVSARGNLLLGSMALLALARLGHHVNDRIQVMGDVFEATRERGLPAIYLACADVFASNGNAGLASRRTLLKVAPELGRLPGPFSSTIGELVKLVSARLVWPGR